MRGGLCGLTRRESAPVYWGGSVPPALKSRANLGGNHICKTDYR